ncbi:hypothetical protein POM88_038934 [Heracleum sosnowskyi]|uniref:TF-B3 domain-containing protein n=1 Tax=Heracleum sosnowskyi TaxID=360622 RepID=A0AAD8HBV0_9APIA|nr:hypothetical protein POM88_038934 [Heracleum sosnowskyi]
MFKYYRLKPYQVVSFHYSGGSIIEIEIFNSYGIEKEYPLRDKPCDKPIFTRKGGGWFKDAYYLECDFEVDKLESQFCYNTIKNGTGVYDLVISKDHLKRGLYHEVLSSNACHQLRLNDTMTWLEIGFNFLKWKIKLRWKNGKVTFYKGWYDFARAEKLRHGDICVFQHTEHPQVFEVAIFARRNSLKFNTLGPQHGKSLMKWFKVLSSETTLSGELEMPRLFIDNFGGLLNETVHLVVADGNEYCVRFCAFNNLLYGMKKLFSKYNVAENFVLFFDYVGRSHFFVSIYNNYCYDILDGLRDKILLMDVLNSTKCPVVVLSDDSSDSDAGTENKNSIMVRSSVVMDETLNTESNRVENDDSPDEAAEDNLPTFRVVLKPSRADKKDHGVAFPCTLLPIYKPWRNGAVITVVWGEHTFKVELHRKENKCRFGYGWDFFTSKLEVVEGQILEFVYRDNFTFEVFVLP